jgi:hypothetical protein
MRETIELRIPEGEASRQLPQELGTCIGDSVRKVVLPLGDEWVGRIARIDKAYRERGRAFFVSWHIARRYSDKELRAAELLTLWPKVAFEPPGALYGTQCDETTGCPHCGAGARQTSELVLDLRRVPKEADLTRTIADELVVSARLAEAMSAAGFTGAAFRPVRQAGVKGRRSESWLQLAVTSSPVELVAPTAGGNDPFDLDEEGAHRCPRGHVVGLNRLSEVHVARSSYSGSDLTCTRQLFGVRRGVLRPRPCLLISPRLHALLKELKVGRFDVELAHLR